MSTDTDHGQPCQPILRRQARDLADSVRTPWGEARIERAFSVGEDHDSFETSAFAVETTYGTALGSFHLDLDRTLPATLRLVLACGLDRLTDEASDPYEHEGTKVAWLTHILIDPLTGGVAEGTGVEVSLKKHDAPPEERLLGFLAPIIEIPALRKAIEAEVAGLVAKAAEDFPRHAGEAYAAMMRHALADADEEAEGQRLRFLEACRRRDLLAAHVGAADAGRDFPRWEEPSPKRPVGELRGFAGEPFDAGDLDEIVLEGAAHVHVETMSDKVAWMGVSLADGRRVVATLAMEKGRLRLSAEVESLD